MKSWSWRVDSSLYYIIPQVYIKSVDCDQRLLADVSAAVQAMNFFSHFFPMVMLCPVAGLVTTWWPYSPGPNAPHSIFCCNTTHLSVQPANMDVYPTVERRAHFFFPLSSFTSNNQTDQVMRFRGEGRPHTHTQVFNQADHHATVGSFFF